MEGLKHFSHEHLLIPMKGERDETLRKSICYGCQTPILAEPIYSCGKCSFFLHKKCAELPKDISHAMHPQHRLILLEKPPYRRGFCLCGGCGRRWSNFTYHCNPCKFDLDIICVTIEDRKLEHPSHVHALTLKNQEARFLCHACGDISEDTSYSCTSCPYWIHESCASSPAIKKRQDHDHPLSLAYCLSDDHIGYGFSCDICNEEIKAYYWNYNCARCRHFLHLRCSGRPKKVSRCISKTESRGFLELPTDNFAGDLLNLIHLLSHIVNPLNEEWNPKEMFHLDGLNADHHRPGPITISNSMIGIDGHSMVRFDLQGDPTRKIKSDQEIRCEACSRPVVSECYKGANSNYFLHVTCALTCTTLSKSALRFIECCHELNLRLSASTWGFFKCYVCNLDSNGYSFNCDQCGLCLDVICAILPPKIAHAAHKHVLTHRESYSVAVEYPICNGCGDSLGDLPSLACMPCRFALGYDCALLPKTAKHRWDKHPLILAFPPFFDQPDKFYCEVCEQEIHPRHWQYRCGECDQSFHPCCIPEVSSSRNIKFGITVDVSQHPHTLKLVPEGAYRSACDSCGESLYCRRAFKCAHDCKFYLCHNCVVKSKGSTNTQ